MVNATHAQITDAPTATILRLTSVLLASLDTQPLVELVSQFALSKPVKLAVARILVNAVAVFLDIMLIKPVPSACNATMLLNACDVLLTSPTFASLALMASTLPLIQTALPVHSSAPPVPLPLPVLLY